ncbi:acyl-CoA dehydrogenase [Mycobacterium sp. IDR2000157661]|nr:acyl-CoA dehydrogenase [Mycobacterium sp. IDR2000157661]
MMEAVFTEYRDAHPNAPVAHRDAGLWQRLDELGLVRLTGAEDVGGSGAGWFEAAELLSAAARHAVRIPLAEHDLLACWLLDAAGVTGEGSDRAVRTVCRLDAEGAARNVPWATGADRIALVWPVGSGYHGADVDIATVEITPGRNAIGEPRDSVAADLSLLDGVPVAAALVTQLDMKAALIRSIQICSALDRIVELSIEHAVSRKQFGRPLSRFQAVQSLIADLAAEAALARAATESTLAQAVGTEWSAEDLEFRVAVARSCTGHAASAVVRNAHQVHGAMGTTREHRLHEFTRAALAWRSEFGSVRYWDEKVTEVALGAGAAGLWSTIAR